MTLYSVFLGDLSGLAREKKGCLTQRRKVRKEKQKAFNLGGLRGLARGKK